MRIFFILSALCFSLVSLETKAQKADSFFTQLEGAWVGKGNLFGTPATFTMNWTKELSGKFAELSFSNAFKDKDGNVQKMEAKGLYKLTNEPSSEGHWFDSRGVMFGLKYTIDGNVLTVLWGDSNIEEGKTEYVINNANKVVVTDYVLRNGAFNQFGEATYQRK